MYEIEKAIRNGEISEIKRILEEEPSEIDRKDMDGTLMAFLAAKTGNIALVKYIVEYSRASMNIVDNLHRNILHYGVMSGNLEVCRYLIEKVGMSPLSGDIYLETPYELADRLGFLDLVKYFEDYVGAPLSEMYKNPIRTGFFPDPSIVRVGDDYYMVNSSFVYFPCIPVSHSKDLINWEIIGYAITNPKWCMLDGIEGGRGYWAPDISYYNGRFYIAATYRLNDAGNIYRKQVVMSSDKPEGPYSKPAIIDEDGIDPSIFTDEDGRRYMLLNRGARIFELNDDCTEQISEAELLYYGDNKRAPEGPHLLKKDGYYYLFEAEGGTGAGHRITVSRSLTLKGNYEPCPYNPIMRQNDEGAALQRCGHGKPVKTAAGDWYMVYLCGRRLKGENGEVYSILGRETALDPITWTADGWPVVNKLKGPSCLQVKPKVTNLGNSVLPDSLLAQDQPFGFEKDSLYKHWLSVRAPEADGYTFHNGHIGIKASICDIDTIEAKNILVRRQTAFHFDAECRMTVMELKKGQDCGTVCYYDENTFVKFALFGRDDGLYVGVVEKIGDDTREHGFTKLENLADLSDKLEEKPMITFRIVTRGLTRSFLYSLGETEFNEIVTLENVYYLCDEGLKKGKRFTGAMVGMYAHGGKAERFRAEFESFKYQLFCP